MTIKLTFVERLDPETSSIERVFTMIGDVLKGRGFDVRHEKLPNGNNALGMLKNALFYRASNSDIYHVTGQIHYIALFLPRDKTVLTIHDLGVLRSRTGIRRWLIRMLLFDYPARRVKYLTVSSQNTKRELLEHTNCPAEKIMVVELPLPRELKGRPKELNRIKPNILQIGTAHNKNLRRVAEALENIPCTLRIIGKLTDAEITFLHEKGIEYVNLIGISDEEMTREYEAADMVVFCSTFEGFGLPIIEAQAMCVPVITSDLSPMKEIAGDGALLVDPFKVVEIRSAVQELLNDPSLSRDLVQRGTNNVRRFSPEKISGDFAAIYQTVIHDQRSISSSVSA